MAVGGVASGGVRCGASEESTSCLLHPIPVQVPFLCGPAVFLCCEPQPGIHPAEIVYGWYWSHFTEEENKPREGGVTPLAPWRRLRVAQTQSPCPWPCPCGRGRRSEGGGPAAELRALAVTRPPGASRQNDGRLEAHHRTENNLADLVPSIILLGRKQ
ncbi:Protein furry [Manis javanica]|nr:Protein furry [Manis javanica]